MVQEDANELYTEEELSEEDLEENSDAIKSGEHWDNSDPNDIKIKEEFKDKFVVTKDSRNLPTVINIDEEQRKKELSVFILDDSNQPQLIDHALGRIRIKDNLTRYFGVMIKEKRIVTTKNGDVEITAEVPAIITEDRHIISECYRPSGLNFQFDTVMTLKRNRWSIKDFSEFINNSELDVDYKTAYESVKKFYDDNMCYEESAIYKFNALWDMVTYHWDIIDKSLVIKKEGVSGSAKSRSMKISSNISFNGRKWLKPNPANFFRYRHKNKSTIYIEEAEKLFSESKNKNPTDNELVDYLNGSYERGNLVPRQNDKNNNQTDEFDPFGFTQISSIKPLQGALKQRSLIQFTVKAKKSDPRSKNEIPTESNPEYFACRSNLYISSLLHYKEYLVALNDTQNTFGLINREWDVAKPIIAMAKCIDKELVDDIVAYIKKSFDVRDIEIDDTSWAYILAEKVVKATCTSTRDMFISNKVLKQEFISDPRVGGGYSDVSTMAIARHMDAIGFGDNRTRNTTGDQRGYKFFFPKVCDVITRNNIINIDDILKIVSEVSGCQFSEKDIRGYCSDTNLTNLKNDSPNPDGVTDTYSTSNGVSEEFIE